MKLYRTIPDIFLTFTKDNYFTINSILNEEDFFSSEDILYEMGYISFALKPKTVYLEANSFNYINEQCKHFFLFPQDAINWYSSIISDYKTLGFRVLEYEFPLEEIYKYVGYGIYGDNIYSVEFLIPESYLRSKVIKDSNSVNNLELKSKIIEYFGICVERLKALCTEFYLPDVSTKHNLIINSKNEEAKLYQVNYLYQLFINNPNYIDELCNSAFFQKFFGMISAFRIESLTNNMIYVSFIDMINHKEGNLSIMDIISKATKPINIEPLIRYERENHIYRSARIISEMGIDSSIEKDKVIRVLRKWQ